MEVIRDFVDKSKYSVKCPFRMSAEFVVIHNTYNDASARNEIAYMKRNNLKVSFHYAIDDREIVQGVPEDRNAWHAGDGGRGDGNRKGIGVEICYSKSGGERFIKAEKRAAEFTAEILKRYGWGLDRVKKHQDFARKYCPHRTLDLGWERFLNMVKGFMKGDGKMSAYNDSPSKWAEKAWKKAIGKQVLDGSRPKEPLLREQAAVILDRLGLLDDFPSGKKNE